MDLSLKVADLKICKKKPKSCVFILSYQSIGIIACLINVYLYISYSPGIFWRVLTFYVWGLAGCIPNGQKLKLTFLKVDIVFSDLSEWNSIVRAAASLAGKKNACIASLPGQGGSDLARPTLLLSHMLMLGQMIKEALFHRPHFLHPSCLSTFNDSYTAVALIEFPCRFAASPQVALSSVFPLSRTRVPPGAAQYANKQLTWPRSTRCHLGFPFSQQQEQEQV